MASFYILNGPKSPWGDYSDILIKGMSCYSDRKDGLIQSNRTGPYVPPISFPGLSDIVVTSSFSGQRESSGLAGLRYQQMIKNRIVYLDWHTWDQSLPEPPEYLEGGEPEGYIVVRPLQPGNESDATRSGLGGREKLRALAPDLNRLAPRGPYIALGEEFPAVAARSVDKCRAELIGQSGSYHYDCPLDRKFFAATGLEVGSLREFIATGADDAAIAAWMTAHATVPRDKIIRWSRRFRANLLCRLLNLDDWLHQWRNGRTGG